MALVQELATLQDEAELKAGAAREGIAAADAQTAAVTKELTVVRYIHPLIESLLFF